MRILLIDDEIVALNALKKRVDWVKYGFSEVLTAQDTVTARELLEKDRADLVLCDIEMPGEDGLSFVEYVKMAYPATECIMVTCHADFNYIKKAMKFGVKDYILKPIDYEELDSLLVQFGEDYRSRQEKEQLGKLVGRARERKESKTRNDQENAGTPLEEDSSEARLRCVKQYIEDHIQEKITVKDLANLVHLNEQHLMRVFKRETGQSVLEYITERRILIAGSLLKDTDYSINFIADCIGCENYSYFTKLFKKFTGFTPREYRMQFKKSS